MRIQIRQGHKSILAGLDFELPMFTVLTGENGSGKTHLFEAIQNTRNGLCSIEGKNLTNITYIPFAGLTPTVDQKCDTALVSQTIKQFWGQIEGYKNRVRSNLKNNTYTGPYEQDPILNHVGNIKHKSLLLEISNRLDITPSDLTEDHISDIIDISSLSGDGFFKSQFAVIFKTYHIRYLDNKLNKVYDSEGIEGGQKYLEEEEFINKYGQPPWEFLNSVLTRLMLPYEVNNPLKTLRDTTFIFKLIHKEHGIEIDTNDLSTGEKTLMSLALAIYNSTSITGRAELLILDEPDAPLHPSMSKLMLEIIEEEIVKKHGIPVLLSTHSPTTIACTPPTALYKISQSSKCPVQCNLHDSMKILTYGIPNLNVSIEHRRQVFVEHTYDVEYYENLFDIVSRKVEYKVLPQFLPPHTLNGSNCNAVLEITRNLRNMGNKHVYGLIDWDLENEPEEQVLILGSCRRYAIENYIFEPYFLALYLIYKKFSSPNDLGLSDCNSYLDTTKKIEQDFNTVQVLSDNVQNKLFTNLADSELTESELINGKKILISSEFLTMRGHHLEDLIKNTWPELKSVRSNNGGDSQLKKDVIITVINDFPELISKDIPETFLQIQ
ncbi:ATP-binding protein [Vibrio parahaemolyticus]|nr:ATP-binding protein [Vibrio parahaemolyticus]